MSLRIKYAHLADYVGIGANGKPLIVGIFDRVMVGEQAPSVCAIPMSYLIIAIEGSIVDAGPHRVEVTLSDGNREPVFEPLVFNTALRPSGEGRPLSTNLIAFLPNLAVKEVGDYEFVVRADGVELGVVPLSVHRQADLA